MYHNDNAPPHFHVEYQGHEAFVRIDNGEILDGRLPNRAQQILREWAVERQAELMLNWSKARALEPLNRIPGADQ